MKSNDSLQQVRPPFAMALTAVFASLLASTTSADHPGNPLILIPLLMLLPWVTWNHPPSLATSGAMLLTVSILAPYSSDGPSDLYLAYRTLWFFAGLLLGAALALIMGERIRSWHPHIRGWRYTLHPARIAAAATGIIVVLALFKPSPQSSQIEQTQAATNNDTVIFCLAAGLFITLLASISPTATMICLIAFISIHGVTTHAPFPNASVVFVLILFTPAIIGPLFLPRDLTAHEAEEFDTSTDASAIPTPTSETSPKEAS